MYIIDVSQDAPPVELALGDGPALEEVRAFIGPIGLQVARMAAYGINQALSTTEIGLCQYREWVEGNALTGITARVNMKTFSPTALEILEDTDSLLTGLDAIRQYLEQAAAETCQRYGNPPRKKDGQWSVFFPRYFRPLADNVSAAIHHAVEQLIQIPVARRLAELEIPPSDIHVGNVSRALVHEFFALDPWNLQNRRTDLTEEDRAFVKEMGSSPNINWLLLALNGQIGEE